MLEKHVKKSLKEFLESIGTYQYWPVPMGFGKKTIDCFFCHQGLFFAVEGKRPAISKATAYQANVLAEIATSGGGVCVENDPALPAVRAMIANALQRRA